MPGPHPLLPGEGYVRGWRNNIWRKFYPNTKDGLLVKILSCEFFVVYGIYLWDIATEPHNKF